MRLPDLPPEILSSIFEQFGPWELRHDVEYLLVCKRLYKAARRTYLADMRLFRLKLSAYDLERLPPKGSLLFKLIQHKAHHISIKLVGHPSRKISSSLWADGPERPQSDSEDSDEADERVIVNGSVVRVWEHDRQPSLQNSRQLINRQLKYLAENLPGFYNLKSFSLEANHETDLDEGPKWNYLYAESIASIIERLPSGLSSLLMDTSGTNLISDEGKPVHVCPLLGQRLPGFRGVRLRMRNVCQALFQSHSGTNLLEKLVIRLNLPMYSDYHGGDTYFDASPCRVDGRVVQQDNPAKEIGLADVSYGRHLPHGMLRIGLRDPRGSGANLTVFGCLTTEFLYELSEAFCYEEDGKVWESVEEWESLRPGSGPDWL